MWTQVRVKDKFMNYLISEEGIVKNIKTNKEVPQYNHPSGYITVSLWDSETKKSIIVLLHRLMMLSFKYIEDHAEKEVNHIDGNKKNNNLNNLEWCTKAENANHAYRTGLNKRSKTVYQYDSNGTLIGTYYSVSEAERQTGIRQSIISGQIAGEYKTAGGFRWSYELVDLPKINKVKRYKREVLQKDKETLQILAKYESASEASRCTGIQQSDITRVCQGKRKTAGGFCWSYEENE